MFDRMSRHLGTGAAALAILAASSLAASTSLAAEENTAAAQGKSETGLHTKAALALRPLPLGAQLTLDAGYRIGLSDSDSLLLKGTYLEAGISTVSSPSNFWGGAYVEALPLAVLKLRLTARSMNHFGTFGYLYLPEDPQNPDWSLDAMDGPISSGHASHGYMLQGQATLQAKIGNFVAMVPGQYTLVDMDVDQVYYETSIDFLLAPSERIWLIQPTVGYVFSFEGADTWLLTGLRWEHAQTVKTDLSRDLPQALGMWKLPGSLASGQMQLVGLGGYWFDHPNRKGEPYFAAQFSVDWRH